MKNIIIMLAASAALPLASAAQDAPRQNRGSNGENMAIFSQMDPAMRIQLMREYDKDGDGRLNEEERAEAVKSIKEKMVDLQQMRLKHAEGVIKKYDKDGDGKLDANELSEFLEEQRQMFARSRGQRQARPVPADILAKYDKDGDGKLSRQERQQMHSDMVAKRQALIKKYDKDGDGKLNDAEKEQLISDPEIRDMMKRMISNPPPPPPGGGRGGPGGRGE